MLSQTASSDIHPEQSKIWTAKCRTRWKTQWTDRNGNVRIHKGTWWNIAWNNDEPLRSERYLQNVNTYARIELWFLCSANHSPTNNSSTNDSSSYCHQHQVMFQFFIRLPFRYQRFVLHFVGHAFKFVCSSFAVHI